MITGKTVTRFGLLRHATTSWNLEKRIQGQTDIPLASQGRAEAERWGALMEPGSWDRVLTSDLSRAVETARIVCDALPPDRTDARLREQDWGKWTGKTLTQIRDATPDLLEAQITAGWRFCPPEGESRSLVWRRAAAALRDAAQRWPGRRILVVTHEGVIKCLLYRLMRRDFLPTEPPAVKPRYLHYLAFGNDALKLVKANALDLNGCV